VFRCDIAAGIEEGLLCPFHYFGVPDEVDYTNIPWRSRRFDEEALTQAVATQSRARNALEQWHAHAGTRTMAFCCSTRHANFMRDFFQQRGVSAAIVHSDSDPQSNWLCLTSTAGLLDPWCIFVYYAIRPRLVARVRAPLSRELATSCSTTVRRSC